MLASRRKALSWAPMWVMLLYLRLQRDGELLQTVEFEEVAAREVVFTVDSVDDESEGRA